MCSVKPSFVIKERIVLPKVQVTLWWTPSPYMCTSFISNFLKTEDLLYDCLLVKKIENCNNNLSEILNQNMKLKMKLFVLLL